MSTIITKGLNSPLLVTKGYGFGSGPVGTGTWPPAVDPHRGYLIILAGPAPFAAVDPRRAYLLPTVITPITPGTPPQPGAGSPWLGGWLDGWDRF